MSEGEGVTTRVKFQVNRDVFSEAVSFTVKLLPQRTTLPILSGVLIEAAGSRARACRPSTTRSPHAPRSRRRSTNRARSSSPAGCSPRSQVDCRHAPVVFSTEEGRISVTCGSANFTLLSMPVEEYPTLPQVADNAGRVHAEEFANAIGQVAVAASRDDVTPVITGVQLEVTNTTISLVATDRYRVAVREIPWDAASSGIEAATALVPARTLAEIGKTFGHSGTVSVAIASSDDRELIAFQADKQDGHVAAHQGQLPSGEAAVPRDRRELRGHEHRRARWMRCAASRSCSNARPRCASRFTIDGLERSRRSAPSRPRHPRRSTHSSPATTRWSP